MGKLHQVAKLIPFQTWPRIKASFVSDLRHGPFESIAAEYRSRKKSERLALVRFVVRDVVKQADDDEARIEQVRVLLAALPESAAVVRGLLVRANAPVLKEVHFSLFCFMPEVLEAKATLALARSVPRFVRDYLLNVRDDRGSSAWMAADMIGDHWNKRDGLRVLVEVLRRARFAPARTAALHGIRMLVPRLARAEQFIVTQALRRAVENDANQRVRHGASSLIDELPNLNRRGAVRRADHRTRPT